MFKSAFCIETVQILKMAKNKNAPGIIILAVMEADGLNKSAFLFPSVEQKRKLILQKMIKHIGTLAERESGIVKKLIYMAVIQKPDSLEPSSRDFLSAYASVYATIADVRRKRR